MIAEEEMDVIRNFATLQQQQLLKCNIITTNKSSQYTCKQYKNIRTVNDLY